MDKQYRHLAAILFTDIVGYTAIMQQDEQKAVSTIKKHNSVLSEATNAFRGEILNNYGDGCLCIFPSALDAVQAALSIQERLRQEPVVPVRIGLHIGEVFFEDGKVLGDGVNVASRVQSLGQANTILLSSEILNNIRNRPEFKTVSLGSYDFKNVNEPMEVYALANEGLHIPKKDSIEGKLKTPPSPNAGPQKFKKWMGIAGAVALFLIGWLLYSKFLGTSKYNNIEKSIAVLPFKNESVDKAENEPFCNGVTLEVLKKLTWLNQLQPISSQSVEKYRDSKISIQDIGHELGVKFIVQGTVQRYNDEIKVFASLVDAESGQQIWADDFPGKMENIFDLQESIAQKIASALEVKISPAEHSKIARAATKSVKALDDYNSAMSAYQSLARSFHSTYSENIKDNETRYSEYLSALSYCNEALSVDSNMADAWLLKGKTFMYRITSEGFAGALEKNLIDSIYIMCNKALQIDDASFGSHLLLSQYFASRQQKDKAWIELGKAYSINPNDFEVNWSRGKYFADTDQVQAIRYYNKALRLDPSSLWTPAVLGNLGFAYLIVCDFDKASEYSRKALQMDSSSGSAARVLFQLGILNLALGRADSVLKYSGMLLGKNDKNALYQLAEAYGELKNDWPKACELYGELWKKFDDHVNEHRYAYALWKTGKKAEAEQLFEKSFEKYKANYPLSYDIAGMYAFRGDKANAYRVLHQFDWGWGSPFLIQHDPLFDNLRNDPEFRQILNTALAQKKALRDQIAKLAANGEL